MNNKKKRLNAAMAGLLGSGLLMAVFGYVNAQGEPPEVIETSSHVFTRMADGVYQVTGTGEVYLMSNALMLVGEEDVLLVDSHVTPNAANALLRSVQQVTSKPVRYLVNSHYHFDHAHGNQVFPEQVEIIGHSYTRIKLNGEMGSHVLTESTHISFTEGVPELVESGTSGWLVPPGNEEALGQAMQQCMGASPGTLAAMGKAGQQAVRQRHDARVEGARLAGLFRAFGSVNRDLG